MSGPAADVALRPERDADAAFLFELFAAGAREVLAAAALPEPMAAQLVQMQYRGQTQAHRALYPSARRWVIEHEGAAAGRLMEADAAWGAHIVDLAVLPAYRRRGVGRTAVTWLMTGQARRGRGVSAQVAVGNLASRALFRGLGFAERGQGEGAHLDVVWPPAA